MKRKDTIDPNIVPLKDPLLVGIENSTNPLSNNFIDYIQLQLSNESLVYKKMVSDYPDENAYSYDRHETLKYALWSDNSSSLKSVYTQSNETNDLYYKDFYRDSYSTSSAEFSVSYGDIVGSAETSKSFGDFNIDMKQSKVVYTQYRNILNDNGDYYVKFNYPSWQSNISTGSRIYAIGTNFSGSFGNSTESGSKFAMPINDYQSVSNGYNYSTALTKNGSIVSWGDNTYGKLGLGNISHTFYPTEISYSGEWKFLSSGPEHTLAIKTDGTLWSWGRNNYGQLGNGTLTDSNIPIQIDSDVWMFASAGNRFSCAIKADGTLWTWGDNTNGQLGNGDTLLQPIVPAQINVGYDGWVKVYASCQTGSDGFAVGIKSDGYMYGWGSNSLNQLGLDTDTATKLLPTLISNSEWLMASAGSSHVLAISSSNELYVWGYNIDNPLGTTSAATVTIPTKNNINGNDWKFVDTSIKKSVGIKINNTVYDWGDGSFLAPKMTLLDYSTEEDKLSKYVAKDISVCDFYNEATDNVDHNHTLILAEYDLNKIDYTKSDFIFSININSDRLRDGIDPGSWELSIKPVGFDGAPIEEISPITLIDDYSLTNANIDRKSVYNIYSGSREKGFYTGSYSVPYGLFYPDNGVIVLNGMSLYSFGSLLFDRNENNQIKTFYTSISGAMSDDNDVYSFKGTSFEREESMYAFVRIHSDEFNYSNNNTYVNKKTHKIHEKISEHLHSVSYFTTIGLYNDEKDLIAVAKLSKPIKKTPDTELVIKVKIKQ